MQRIMLATDFSERSDRALRRAVLLARAHGAVLNLVHVVDDDRPPQIVEHEAADARDLLRDLAHSLRTDDGIPCEAEIVLADPFVGIGQAVAARAPDLLVIGPHRRRLLGDVFRGTTAERTIRSVDCPTLMVNGPPIGRWRHILLTTDLSENAKSALRRFADLGLGVEARRSVLHVFDALGLRLTLSDTMTAEDQERYLSDQRGAAHRDLAQFMAAVGAVQAERVVRPASAPTAQEINQAADVLKADLIVVSTRGKGAMARMLLGSVTEQVLQHAVVDVLSLPPARVA